MTPFELDLECQPKAPVDFLRAPDSQIESVNEFRQRMGEMLRDGQFAPEIAKARQSAYGMSISDPHP